MIQSRPYRIILVTVALLFLANSAFIGIVTGLSVARNINIKNIENVGEFSPSLPSRILDIKGRMITEFIGEENRELVTLDMVPKELVFALLTREDSDFYHHNGFSVWGTTRAVVKILTGSYFSGGSTLTQQLAGHLYADRTQINVTRKLIELWWAWQLERQLTKDEILETYLNKMPFGHNTYGIEAASEFYFRHSISEITTAEAVMLVIQLVRPGLYSPITNPERARVVQKEILSQMVENGFVSQEEAQLSYNDYWRSYDWSRDNKTTAFFEREDNAPYFSEFIRSEMENLLYGSADIYKDGYTIHTTLDLDMQNIADATVKEGLERVEQKYQDGINQRLSYVNNEYIPIIDLLSLTFNQEKFRIAGSQTKKQAKEYFLREMNPIMDMAGLLFSDPDINHLAGFAYSEVKSTKTETPVETALIALDNDTGYIKAMIGGRKFDRTNQFNRAVQAEIQPGSSFKPLYYSEAISGRDYTPASMIYDGPTVFWYGEEAYTPDNYGGAWQGNVLLRNALARSLNIPALKVLETIGFDRAIKRASRLLGISDPEEIASIFPRKYPLGLGIIKISPIRMARAFATFANQGREVEPLAIRYIEGRNGQIVLDVERELRKEQESRSTQIMSPQSAYVMTDMLQSTVKYGTLSYGKRKAGGFNMPMAGKTGTTQNWSDAWAIGYSPYMTTAVWFGFDSYGNSLGTNQSGTIAAGPVWADFMKKTHDKLTPVDFEKPESGLIEVEIDIKTGDKPTENSEDGHVRGEIFLIGTEPGAAPGRYVIYDKNEKEDMLLNRYMKTLLTVSLDQLDLPGLSLPELEEQEDLLDDFDLDLDFNPDGDSNGEEDSGNDFLLD